MSTGMPPGWSQAMPRTRLAHLGPTPAKLVSVSKSQGSLPPNSSTTRVAMAWIVRLLGSWKVQAWINSSIRAGVEPAHLLRRPRHLEQPAGRRQRDLLQRADGDDAGDEDLERRAEALLRQLEQDGLGPAGHRLARPGPSPHRRRTATCRPERRSRAFPQASRGRRDFWGRGGAWHCSDAKRLHCADGGPEGRESGPGEPGVTGPETASWRAVGSRRAGKPTFAAVADWTQRKKCAKSCPSWGSWRNCNGNSIVTPGAGRLPRAGGASGRRRAAGRRRRYPRHP